MIHLALPGLPPSSNHAYFNLRGKGRSLTTEGRAYLTTTKGFLQQHYRREMMFFQKNVPYFVLVYFYFSEIETIGYPKKAENRYKTLDGNNRSKLLEDALKDAGGVDDSQTMGFFWLKKKGPFERVELRIWNLETEGNPFDDTLRTF